MFTHSIRWRLQLWLGFLLVCVLSGFGVTVYQLHRNNQFAQIDEELERRVDVLSSALRRPASFNRGPVSREGPLKPDEMFKRPPGFIGPTDQFHGGGGPGMRWGGLCEFHLP